MPISRRVGSIVGALLAVLALARVAAAVPPTPLKFDPPEVTTWKPLGCRSVPTTDPVLGSRDRWRMLHSDGVNSDEVSIAAAPTFVADWRAEPATFNVAVPTFDRAGNLYFAPFLPYENVTMISLDPATGARRWAIPGTGAPVGACAPMVLNDPDHPGEEIVYQALYDRALAVRTDGTIVWDVPTGLTLTGVLRQDSVPGINYHPGLDAIVGLIPLRRMGTPDEVAPLAVFLCAASASYITGQVVSVNGGLNMVG